MFSCAVLLPPQRDLHMVLSRAVSGCGRIFGLACLLDDCAPNSVSKRLNGSACIWWSCDNVGFVLKMHSTSILYFMMAILVKPGAGTWCVMLCDGMMTFYLVFNEIQRICWWKLLKMISCDTFMKMLRGGARHGRTYVWAFLFIRAFWVIVFSQEKI